MSKYCSNCQCYIPDEWDSCPSCGKYYDEVLEKIKRGEGLSPLDYVQTKPFPIQTFPSSSFRNPFVNLISH